MGRPGLVRFYTKPPEMSVEHKARAWRTRREALFARYRASSLPIFIAQEEADASSSQGKDREATRDA